MERATWPNRRCKQEAEVGWKPRTVLLYSLARGCCWKFSCSWWKITFSNLSLNQTELFKGDNLLGTLYICLGLESIKSFAMLQDTEAGPVCCSVSQVTVPNFGWEVLFFPLGHSSGSQGGANTTSSPMRKPQIPGEFQAVEKKKKDAKSRSHWMSQKGRSNHILLNVHTEPNCCSL